MTADETQAERERDAAKFEARAAEHLNALAEPWQSIYRARVEAMCAAVRAGSPDGTPTRRGALLDQVARAVVGEGNPRNARGYRLYYWVTKRDNRNNALWYPLLNFEAMPVRALFPLALRIHRALVRDFGVESVREAIAQGRSAGVKLASWPAHIAGSMNVSAARALWREVAGWIADAGDDAGELAKRIATVGALDVRASLLGSLAIVRALYAKAERRDVQVERAMDLCERAFIAYGRDSIAAMRREAKRITPANAGAWADTIRAVANINEARSRTDDLVRLVGSRPFEEGALTVKRLDKLNGRLRASVEWMGRWNGSQFSEEAARAVLAYSMRDDSLSTGVIPSK